MGKKLSTFDCHQFQGPPPGATTILPAEATELDFLFMMMNSDIFQYIADETNRYAEEKVRTKPDPKWRGVTDVEVKAYIGMKIVSGVVSVPNPLYFTKDSLFKSTGISEKFTRD